MHHCATALLLLLLACASPKESYGNESFFGHDSSRSSQVIRANECPASSSDVFSPNAQIPSVCSSIVRPICVCDSGFYQESIALVRMNHTESSRAAQGTISCSACPKNAVCFRGWVDPLAERFRVPDATVASYEYRTEPLPMPGYSADLDGDMRPCKLEHICPGYLEPSNCVNGRTGRLCAECEMEQFVPVGVSCMDGHDSFYTWMAFCIALFLVIVSLPSYVSLISLLRSFSFTKLLRFVKYLQVLAAYRFIHTDWPSFMLRWIRVITYSTFSWGELVTPAFTSSFNDSVLISMAVDVLLPYVFSISFVVFWYVTYITGRERPMSSTYAVTPTAASSPLHSPQGMTKGNKIRQNIVLISLLVINLSYLNASIKAVMFFTCERGPHQDFYMVHYPSIPCYDSQWNQFLVFGILGLVQYVSLPFAFFQIYKIVIHYEPSELMRSIFGEYAKVTLPTYARHARWFENIENFQKAIIVVILTQVDTNQNKVELALMGFLMFCLLNTLRVMPFQDPEDLIFEIGGLTVSILWLLGVIAFSDEERFWSDEKMGSEIFLCIVLFLWHFYMAHRVIFSDHSFFGFRPDEKSMYASHSLGLLPLLKFTKTENDTAIKLWVESVSIHKARSFVALLSKFETYTTESAQKFGDRRIENTHA